MLAYGPDRRRPKALELTDVWSRLSRQHLSGGQGCGCSFGGLMFQASDFELDIVEFVVGGADTSGLPGVGAYIDDVAKRGPDRYSLPALLKALAEGDYRGAGEAEIDFTLDRLGSTLSNIEKAHSRGRFACD